MSDPLVSRVVMVQFRFPLMPLVCFRRMTSSKILSV